MNDQAPAATEPPDYVPLLSRAQIEGVMDRLEADTGREIPDRDYFAEQLDDILDCRCFDLASSSSVSVARMRSVFRRLSETSTAYEAALKDAVWILENRPYTDGVFPPDFAANERILAMHHQAGEPGVLVDA